jgi:hypothetical protein
VTSTEEIRDQVDDALCLIGIAIEKLLQVNEVPELANRDLADALDNLGNANDILRDTYNRW